MAEIPVNFLLEKLSAFLVNEAELLGGIRLGIEEIRDKLEIMKAFLKDADKKRDSTEVINTWVNQVRRAAYDMEDVIDEFVLRSGTRSHASDGIMNSLRTLLGTIQQLPAKRNLAIRTQEIKRKINEMERSRHEYDIERIEEAESLQYATIRRWQDHGEANFIREEEIVGIEQDVKLLVQQLVGGKDLENHHHFISVVGMGGLGKTTLVRKVYNDPKVKEHFNCSAWVSVSQSFDGKNLLKSMLTEFCQVKKHGSFKEGKEKTPRLNEDVHTNTMSEDDLKKELQKYLEGKKIILVLDDVWDRRVWDYLKLVLPKNFSGSKVTITTRKRSVASALETPENTNFVHELKTMSEDVAMALLCRKAFPGDSSMPLEFEEVGKSMLQRCGGLPLAIAALGGILYKKKTLSEWKKVNNNLRYQLDNGCAATSSITGILKLSYNELPLHLKPCFLYCGLFPEDHLIKRNKLIRLWIAEGFIKEENGDMTMEEVGEEYMMQLIDRSMLQIGGSSIGGSRVKSCKIHDLMRDLAISISQEVEFFFKLDNQVKKENVKKNRRMCVIGENKENYEISVGNQHMRSLLRFDVGEISADTLISYSKSFKLLRVLDLEDAGIKKLPKQIGKLFLLRYLSLRGNEEVEQLPRSIGRLQNLETLDIRWTGIRKLPSRIVRLRNLRHLCMRRFLGTKMAREMGNLICLQTLTGVDGSGKGICGEIGKLKELRRLEISGVEEDVAEELYAAISGMTHLFSLTISRSFFTEESLPSGKKLLEHPPPNLRIFRLYGLCEWPSTLAGSFNNLISLTLWNGELREDPFPSLSSLPSLLRLELWGLYNIKGLQCGPQGFPELQKLVLFGMSGLETITLEEGSMPCLKHLSIWRCEKLKMVPQGIQHLHLQELLIGQMPKDFTERLKEGGEDRPMVQHIPVLRFE